jgi:hypothetical protein
VVAIIGSPTDPDQLLRSGLGSESLAEALEKASSRDVHVELVSWLPSVDVRECVAVGSLEYRAAVDRMLGRIGADRLYAFFQKFPAGRLINSLGPLDQSRVFWRAVRKHENAMRSLRSADILLAVDLPAVRTAWQMRRRIRTADAYYGLASTLKVFAARFAQTTSS